MLLPCSAAATAESLQSCPTLCDPIDCSPPGSAVPEILQERTPEWVAISFSNAWKWKVKVRLLSHVHVLGIVKVQSRGVGWGGRWERGSGGKGHVYTYGWVMLIYGRGHGQHNIVKQYPPIKKKLKIYHRVGGLETEEMCCSKFWSLEVQDQGAAWSGDCPLPGHRLLIIFSRGGKGLSALWVYFIRSLISFMRALSSWPHLLQKPYPLPSPLGIRISIYEFLGLQIQTMVFLRHIVSELHN